MTEKKYESLDQPNLYQNVSQSHGDEVKQGPSIMVGRSISHYEWQDKKCDHRHNVYNQQHPKDGHAQVHLPIHGGTVRVQVQKPSQLYRKKEKRLVVGDWGDVVLVCSREGFRVVALNQAGKSVGLWLERGIQKPKVLIIAQMLGDGCFFFRREGAFLRQNCYWNSIFVQVAIRYHDEVLGRIRHSELMQPLHRDRDDTQSLARFTEFPTCDCNDSVGLEVLEIFAKRLRGVKAVLA